MKRIRITESQLRMIIKEQETPESGQNTSINGTTQAQEAAKNSQIEKGAGSALGSAGLSSSDVKNDPKVQKAAKVIGAVLNGGSTPQQQTNEAFYFTKRQLRENKFKRDIRNSVLLRKSDLKR